jgi:SAM-dependent methyltransferase
MDASGAQERAWEREYKTQKMLSPSNVPHADVVRFAKWLKKDYKRRGSTLDFEALSVLDLGSGTGRNAFYFAERGASVTGYEISDTALARAREYAAAEGLSIKYEKRDIGAPYPLADESIDIVLDITSSNSLTDNARKTYLEEVARVLKPSGYFVVRALSFEGDQNAKELVARFPGPDQDTYIHPDLHLVEKVFSRDSFTETYGAHFATLKLERTQHYATVSGRVYKRSYWVAYLTRR